MQGYTIFNFLGYTTIGQQIFANNCLQHPTERKQAFNDLTSTLPNNAGRLKVKRVSGNFIRWYHTTYLNNPFTGVKINFL